MAKLKGKKKADFLKRMADGRKAAAKKLKLKVNLKVNLKQKQLLSPNLNVKQWFQEKKDLLEAQDAAVNLYLQV